MQFIEQRHAVLLTRGQAKLSTLAADGSFDLVELADAIECFFGRWGLGRLIQVK